MQSPILGVGPGVYQHSTDLFGGYAHNQWLNMLAEEGLLGLVVLTYLMFRATNLMSPLSNPMGMLVTNFLAISFFSENVLRIASLNFLPQFLIVEALIWSALTCPGNAHENVLNVE